MLDKYQIPGVFSISRVLLKSLINNSCIDSRSRNDIDIKIGSLFKLEKKNTISSKNLAMISCLQIITLDHFPNLRLICSILKTQFFMYAPWYLYFLLTFSSCVTYRATHNTNLSSSRNISERIRLNCILTTTFLKVNSTSDQLSLTILYILIFKVKGNFGISKINFFRFSSPENIKAIQNSKTI